MKWAQGQRPVDKTEQHCHGLDKCAMNYLFNIFNLGPLKLNCRQKFNFYNFYIHSDFNGGSNILTNRQSDEI